MFSVLSLGFLALSQARVHQFWAEHNWICNLCEEVVGAIESGASEEYILRMCKDPTNEPFTDICQKISVLQNEVTTYLSQKIEHFDICNKLQLCEQWEDESYFTDTDAVRDELIEQINLMDGNSWTAGVNTRFQGMKLTDVRKQLGAVVDNQHTYKLPTMKYDQSKYVGLPTDFDSRSAWPACASVIGNIRDQSSCGSCWAFGSTESFNDRKCIASSSNATETAFLQLLSTEDTASCCNGFDCGFSAGCNGGQPSAAWGWFTTEGVVTGGNYSDIGKDDTCRPYSLPPCAHHVTSPKYPDCPSNEYPTPACTKSCSNTGYPTSFENDKKKATKSYQLRTVEDIMTDIQMYGTTSCAFTVYEDFLSYKSGVYVHKTGSALGGHAVKIIGWGVENDVDYWLCVNSWNDSWGDNGYFKIKKGVDECGIEDDVTGGHA